MVYRLWWIMVHRNKLCEKKFLASFFQEFGQMSFTHDVNQRRFLIII